MLSRQRLNIEISITALFPQLCNGRSLPGMYRLLPRRDSSTFHRSDALRLDCADQNLTTSKSEMIFN
jgi:hypothetical protein